VTAEAELELDVPEVEALEEAEPQPEAEPETIEQIADTAPEVEPEPEVEETGEAQEAAAEEEEAVADVIVLEPTEVEPTEVEPSEAEPAEVEPAAAEAVPAPEPRKPLDRGQRMARLGGVVAIFAGLAVAVTGIILASQHANGPQPAAPTKNGPPLLHSLTDVATDVTAYATDGGLGGERRIVRTSDGHLLVLYPSQQGLQIVSDNGDNGTSWQQPITVPEVVASSLSVAIDGSDNLHIAFTNPSAAIYIVLVKTSNGYQPSRFVVLQQPPAGDSIGVAWDATDSVAHVVWARQVSGARQRVQWAAISGLQHPRIVETKALSPATRSPVIANIAADPNSKMLTTYDHGSKTEGWFSRTIVAKGQSFDIGGEEKVPTHEVVAAGSLSLDAKGAGHLALDGNGGAALDYFTHDSKGWSAGPAPAKIRSGTTVSSVVISSDVQSKLTYLYFQTNSFAGVFLSVNNGKQWKAPYRVAPGDAGADWAATSPTVAETSSGISTLMWTTAGSKPVIQAATITAR
jgi:hypothetical protein